jgi:hypothetical protein
MERQERRKEGNKPEDRYKRKERDKQIKIKMANQ